MIVIRMSQGGISWTCCECGAEYKHVVLDYSKPVTLTCSACDRGTNKTLDDSSWHAPGGIIATFKLG